MGRFRDAEKCRRIENMYNDKKRRIVAGVIVAILVIAMVLPLLSYAL